MPSNRHLNRPRIQVIMRHCRAAFAEQFKDIDVFSFAAQAMEIEMDDLGIPPDDPIRRLVRSAVPRCLRPGAQRALDQSISDSLSSSDQEQFHAPS